MGTSGPLWSNHHHHPLGYRTGDIATGKEQPASWGCALQIQLMSVATSTCRHSSQVYLYASLVYVHAKGTHEHNWKHWRTNLPESPSYSRHWQACPFCSRHVLVIYPSPRKNKGTNSELSQKWLANGWNRWVNCSCSCSCSCPCHLHLHHHRYCYYYCYFLATALVGTPCNM